MWEIAYSFFSSIGLGMILSSQFTALSAAKPDENAATSVTTFYLCQQIGFMAGVTSSRSLVRSAIENGLKATLGENTASQEVSLCSCTRGPYRRNKLTLEITYS